MIRYFCLVAGGPVGDLGYAYLTALRTTGVPLRAIPIGGATFGVEKRWTDVSTLFAVPMTLPYLNVVCATAGMPMGTRAVSSSFSSSNDLPAELRRVLGPHAVREAVIYEPKTALEGLFTVGCKNIAILRALPLPAAREITALLQYDLVLCPTAQDVAELAALGIVATHMPPSADGLLHILEELCGSDTFATTTPSLATAAPPATTCSPSTASTASSSRSSPSAAETAARRSHQLTSYDPLNRGTQPSIRSLCRGLTSLAQRTWRSIMRLLGHSRE
jgi:hypothetical protein